MAAVDPYHCTAGFCRHAGEFVEQRGLAHAAGAMDVHGDECRLVGQESRAEVVELRITPDEAPPTR